MPTQILACKCTNEYQDRVYGVSMRVHNHSPKVNQGTGGWRCTVCKREQGKQKVEKKAEPATDNTKQGKSKSKSKSKNKGKKQK